MNITRIALPTLAAAGLALAGLGALPAQAADPASRAVDVCRVTIVSVKALDLQDQDNEDETFLRLGDTTTVQRNYTDNRKRNRQSVAGEDDFVGSENVRLIEHDNGAGNNDLVASATLPCANDSGTDTLAGNGAIYQVTWETDILP